MKSAHETIVSAFEAKRAWVFRRERPSGESLDDVFDALDIIFESLSRAKQNELHPPKPGKRGRKRTPNEYALAYFIDQATKHGRKWGAALESARMEFAARSIAWPEEADDSTLRRIVKRYRDGDIRVRLIPRKIPA
jgi:hypothetical protein